MTIIHADCLEAMRQMADNSVDSIVTDPPYGINFMGRKWDYDVPSVEIWAECLRVLKPGGHMLAFSGTRTQHRMAVNIEDAGFELRDVITWHYGSGFPKSLNVGKAIDKTAGLEREVVGVREGGADKLMETRPWNRADSYDKKINITAPASPEAAQWEGWGTALKPATEFISLCRKPLSEKTIAANVLKWGTGGINIDECRVEGEPWKAHSATGLAKTKFFTNGDTPVIEKNPHTKGRFPANLILDDSECVRRGFPETKSAYTNRETAANNHGKPVKVGSFGGSISGLSYTDSGSAARFFYCAKASKADRNEGLELLEAKRKAGAEFRPNHMEKAQNGDSGNPYGRWDKVQNNHPTVKPTQLMRYLVRLVTPPDGIVLDPFFGSGSTGKAAKIEGFDFIGIEREAEYIEIAKRRVEAAEPEKPQAEQLSLV